MVEQVKLKRNLPNSISVEIKEREGKLVFVQEEDYFFVDSSGVLFEKIPRELAENFLKIKIYIPSVSFISNLGGKVIEDDLLEQIFKIESEFKNNLKIELKETLILEDKLTVKTAQGWEIYFSVKENTDWQITELRVVLEKEIPLEKREELEYIDLRFSRVYYKYY